MRSNWVSQPVELIISHTPPQSRAKRAKTTRAGAGGQLLAMALYQGKAGSGLLEAMTGAVAQGKTKRT